MDLTGLLLRFAGRVPRVLVVPVPGRPRLRMDAERALARRGWAEATSPADADVLLVAGTAGPEMEAVIAHLWRRIPAPRVQVELVDGHTLADVDRLLDAVPDLLADPRRAREEAAAAAATADVDQTDGGHGGHGGHDHHAMGMALPGNLGMADLAPDRDGLTLDVLNISLGPALPDWPAGLVVDVVMQGDVIASATARVLDGGRDRPVTEPDEPAVQDLDVVARVLSVAGWPGPAARARDLRDRLRDVTDTDAPVPARELMALLRRVRRSNVLRLMLRRTDGGQGVDVADLLGRRLDRLEAYVAGRAVPPAERVALDALGNRLAGAECAAARLLVAVLDPDVDGEPVAAGTTGAAETDE